MTNDSKLATILIERLQHHQGHNVVIANYGAGICLSLECEDCNEVIIDTEILEGFITHGEEEY